MDSGTTPGQRVRKRRMDLGVQQAALARKIGISAAFLNLIEHDKRRIGHDLLNALAETLNTTRHDLQHGADGALVDQLMEASVQTSLEPNLRKAQELAEQFPDWARLIAAQSDRIKAVENSLSNLSDRMAHDPFFSDTLHEIRSAVTSIQSTSSILVDAGDMDPNLDRRFRENIYGDSLRLADAMQGLTDFMNPDANTYADIRTPHEEVFAILQKTGFHISDLERRDVRVADVVDQLFAGVSLSARSIAMDYCAHYHRVASVLPLADVLAMVRHYGFDLAALGRDLDVGFPVLFQRLASLPPIDDLPSLGLVMSDASGRLVHWQPCLGFELPRAGFGCGLWPLYSALQMPQAPQRAVLSQIRRAASGAMEQTPVEAFAVAEQVGTLGFDRRPLYRALMLLVPMDTQPTTAPQAVGTTCRVCQSATCFARSEPSIVKEGF